MKNQSIANKLISLRLRPMADAYLLQEEDPSIRELSFEDRFGLLVDVLYNRRLTNGIKRLIKEAHLDQPDACIADIDYRSGRALDKRMIMYLAGCEYIADSLNVFITGAAGCGKTYLACALAMEAVKQRISAYYILLPDLLLELEQAREEKRYSELLSFYAKKKLLIIDEWLGYTPTPDEQQIIKALLSARRNKASTIFCSQYLKEGWYQQLGGKKSTEAEAILDRIIHDAYEVNITYKDPNHAKSMREVYSKRKAIY